MKRKLRKPGTQAKRKPSLKARFAEARWKIWRARSKSEYVRWLATIQEAADSDVAEAWETLFDVHRKAGRRRLARTCLEKVFETAPADDAIFVANECIYEGRFGSKAQQRRRGFDPKLGLAELERRARAGEVDAMAWLAHAYHFGGPIRRDPRKELLWLRRAARLSDLDSMTNLGVRHRYGEGVRKDAKTAVRWYRKAAAKSCSSATHNLGVCYTNGEGVRRDERIGLEWFQKAARLGNRSSMVRVAEARIEGKFIQRDVKRGLNALRLRAKHNNPHALERLGERLIDGRDVRKDVRRGRRMLAKAARIERSREGDWSWS